MKRLPDVAQQRLSVRETLALPPKFCLLGCLFAFLLVRFCSLLDDFLSIPLLMSLFLTIYLAYSLIAPSLTHTYIGAPFLIA